jgi:hypothetical protein
MMNHGASPPLVFTFVHLIALVLLAVFAVVHRASGEVSRVFMNEPANTWVATLSFHLGALVSGSARALDPLAHSPTVCAIAEPEGTTPE